MVRNRGAARSSIRMDETAKGDHRSDKTAPIIDHRAIFADERSCRDPRRSHFIGNCPRGRQAPLFTGRKCKSTSSSKLTVAKLFSKVSKPTVDRLVGKMIRLPLADRGHRRAWCGDRGTAEGKKTPFWRGPDVSRFLIQADRREALSEGEQADRRQAGRGERSSRDGRRAKRLDRGLGYCARGDDRAPGS
jgi:hypothetical protein